MEFKGLDVPGEASVKKVLVLLAEPGALLVSRLWTV